MKMMNKVMCGAMLGCAMLLVSAQAKAQSSQDKTFLATASQANVDEIAMSKLAEDKATNPEVRDFAELMVKQHTELGNDVKPFADKWGVTCATEPDAAHREEMERLKELSGAKFDKAYMNDMEKDHTKALKLFTNEVKYAKDPQFKVTVEKGKSMVAAHKNMAYALDAKLKG